MGRQEKDIRVRNLDEVQILYSAHNSLSHFFFCRTKKVDGFTSRLLDIHAKMLDMNKKEVFSFACIFWFETNDLSCLYII